MNPRDAVCFLAVLLFACVPLTLGQGTYTQIDVPGAVSTSVSGIDSAGDLVGSYGDASGIYHGFLLSGGVYTTIDVPGAAHGTYAQGVNDLGKIVGYSYVSAQPEGFLYDVQSQTFTTITYPGATSTFVRGINNSGVIVGYALNQNNSPVAFEYVQGAFRRVLPPGWKQSGLAGINNSGEAVGSGANAGGSFVNFFFNNGNFHHYSIPAPNAYANGISDAGVIVGAYKPTWKFKGFVYQKGRLRSLTFSSSTSTLAEALNNSGEVAGLFLDKNGVEHGFKWTPPVDPATK